MRIRKKFISKFVILILVLTFVVNLIAPGLPSVGTPVFADEETEEVVDGKTRMEERYDKSDSMTGVVYNELRYMEVEWANESRLYGTSAATSREMGMEIDLFSMLFTEKGINARQYSLSNVGHYDLLGRWAIDINEDHKIPLIKMSDGLRDKILEAASFGMGLSPLGIAGSIINPDGTEATIDTVLNYVDKHLNKYVKREDNWLSNGLAYLAEKAGVLDQTDGIYEGILGPQPFNIPPRESEEEEQQDYQNYKFLRDIDVGNELEIRGKPLEGFTSNAKEILAMTNVFYAQSIDELMEAQNEVKGAAKVVETAKNKWRNAWTRMEQSDIPILAALARLTQWSWTAIFRNYAYPLANASHQENFFLNSYIYPTLWTTETSRPNPKPVVQRRWDGARGPENGDQIIKMEQFGDGTEAIHGKLGISTEGGSSKVMAKALVSTGVYQQYGDADWEEIELCPSEIYNGYGCMSRMKFSYKWPGRFTVDMNDHIVQEVNLYNKSLFYCIGEEDVDDLDDEALEMRNVSADVSPWYEDMDADNGYHKDSCLRHFFKITDSGAQCWIDGIVENKYKRGDGEDIFNDICDCWEINKNSIKFGSRTIPEKLHLTNPVWFGLELVDICLIQEVREEEDGVRVFVSEEANDPEKTGYAEWDVYGFEIFFPHHCQKNHLGVYCGGHLQLRTRGVVYGFSADQMNDGAKNDETQISKYEPKFLDLDKTDIEKQYFPDKELFNIDEHISDTGRAKIEEEDLENLYLCEDLFDIDVLIKRPKSTYVGFSSLEATYTEEEDGSKRANLPPWDSWTLTNMGQAVTLCFTDWTEHYNLADTQTISGGIYKGANLDNIDAVTAINNSVAQTIIEELDSDLFPSAADITDPEEKRSDGKTILSDEDREQIYRLRHIEYALNCVGKVGYSQLMHWNMYQDTTGHNSDCSGFVSNIWRDVYDYSHNTSELKADAEEKDALSQYTGPDTEGIKPGDIILRHPDAEDAHALLYIGKFDKNIIYSVKEDDGSYSYEKSGDMKVFTVDCSSMILTTDDLPAHDIPAESALREWLGELVSLGKTIGNAFLSIFGGNTEEIPTPESLKHIMVRSGNTRFAARTYLNSEFENDKDTWYISMDKLWGGSSFSVVKNNGRLMTGINFKNMGLRNDPVEYWHLPTMDSDITIDSDPVEIDYEFPGDYRPIVSDVEIDDLRPVDERYRDVFYDPSYNPLLMSIEGQVMLEMPEGSYLNQGWIGQVTRGDGRRTIAQAACCDCSYMMAASYLTGRVFSRNEAIKISSSSSSGGYVSGQMFEYGSFLSNSGLRWNHSDISQSSFNPQYVMNAIDNGNPVVMGIQGWFDWHPRSTGHYVLITGYNETGFTMYDPGSWQNSYCTSGITIPYSSFSSRNGKVTELNVISR